MRVEYLSGYYLKNANLRGSNLQFAKLDGANLENADIQICNFENARLVNTNLKEANLLLANLKDANLKNAHLEGAILQASHIEDTCLENANLNDSVLGFTVFGNIDLTTVQGLETIKHNGPSYIDIQTLYRSKGNIPEVFLRGCGVPDNLIEYLPALTGKGIKYYSCFISYSHKDDELAQRVHNDLQAAGVRCWFAPHDMKIGDKIRPVINESIRFHDKILLILSEHSVESDWVEHEVEHALDRERIEKKNILFPVRLDHAVMVSNAGWAGNVKRQRHIGDFSRWKDHDAYKAAFDRLLRDLKTG
ncbi:MAG: toll/interleukin-1 receptor domain-containing protein [Chlorobaculum sp.]|jgi:hypothetical protein|nr:toll/interleukin-1 receptor domain-containing protein [Chlorobaculum sp.]